MGIQNFLRPIDLINKEDLEVSFTSHSVRPRSPPELIQPSFQIVKNTHIAVLQVFLVVQQNNT